MKDYVFLDTNVWIYCCLDSQENFNHSALVKIHRALSDDKFILVVPEVMEAELFARLKEHLRNLRGSLHKVKQEIKINYPVYKKRLEATIDHQIQDIDDNFAKSEKEIDAIFQHQNTIRIGLKSDDFTAAYMRCVRRKRPFNAEKMKRKLDGDDQLRVTEVQNDAIIVEQLIRYFAGKDYRLHIGNYDQDYMDPATSLLHPDIAADLKNAVLYRELKDLLLKVKTRIPNKSKEEEDGLKTISLGYPDLSFIRDIVESTRLVSKDIAHLANIAATIKASMPNFQAPLLPTITSMSSFTKDLAGITRSAEVLKLSVAPALSNIATPPLTDIQEKVARIVKETDQDEQQPQI